MDPTVIYSFVYYQSYMDDVRGLDDESFDTHLRTGYRSESQQWPDYLDCLEEWDYQ